MPLLQPDFADIAHISVQANSTMFMAILTAFQALLVRYSQEDDLVVGVPYAGRNRAETEGLMGAFMGAVALRAQLDDAPSFTALLARMRKVCLLGCSASRWKYGQCWVRSLYGQAWGKHANICAC